MPIFRLAERWKKMMNGEADIHLMRMVYISNVWLLKDQQGRRFLIDTGDATERLALQYSLHLLEIANPGDLTAVLLTHRHRDHAGNAAWLRRRYQCPVICHPADAPFLEGLARPRPLAVQPMALLHKALCTIEDHRPARCLVDDTYHLGKWRWGFEVYPVPGHTEGSVMLYHRPTAALFSGDAIITGIPPFRFFDHLRLAVPEYSPEVERCHESVRKFLEDPPEIKYLCAGHGPMVSKEVNARLQALAAPPATTAEKLKQAVEKGISLLPDFMEKKVSGWL